MDAPMTTTMAEPPPPPAGNAAARAQELAKTQADEQKDKVAQALASAARALRESSGTLEQQGQPALGEAARVGADKMQELSGYLRETDAAEIAGRLRDTARQRPLLTAGVGFLVTLAAARVIKVVTAQPPAQSAEPPPEPIAAPTAEPAPEATAASQDPDRSDPATPSPTRRRARKASSPLPAATADASGTEPEFP